MQFKKGDKVKVKPWKRMAQDDRVYIDSRGDITDKALPYSFTREMERFCKCPATVHSIDDEGNIYLKLDNTRAVCMFRDWMLEPDDDEDETIVHIIQRGVTP